MTLVLPFGGDQINNSLFSGAGSNRGSSMPCVFDGEALDFESALMTDWTSDIGDYNATADDFATAAPSDASELKRKSSSIISSDEEHPSKKLRLDDDEDPMQSDIVSSSTSPADFHRHDASPADFLHRDASPADFLPHDASSSSSLAVAEELELEETGCRRRGPAMWSSSRQRWKDERKRVLKMSVGKLSEIEDPELCLLRSVLVNNTIKRLHGDIRGERLAKRQQRLEEEESVVRAPQDLGGAKRDGDEASYDELFGEDFLRVPDRRLASSPAPETDPATATTSNSQTPCDSAASRFGDGDPPSYAAPSFRRPCAAQFRTNDNNIFPPRVPILDSVVYHSLLASLESS